jgi:hypothetical protein
MKISKLSHLLVVAATLAAPTAALANDTYGSLAYSPRTGAFGWSVGFSNRRGAEREAMANCDARDCRKALYFVNSCGALARGEDGGWGSSWGESPRQARRKALDICERNSYACEVIVTKCSDE